MSSEIQYLWKPKGIEHTKLDEFRKHVNRICKLNLVTYEDLYKWSVTEYSKFWAIWWEFGEFISSSGYTEVVDEKANITAIPRWFPGVKLNFSQNLLRFKDDRIALYYTGEGQKSIQSLSYNALHKRTILYMKALKRVGIHLGDRVAGYLPNGVVAVEAMLGVAAVGGVWSSTSPDFGVTGVLDRFGQISPRVIFSVEAVVYNGKVHDHLSKLKDVIKGLKGVEKVVIAPFVHKAEDIDISDIPNSVFLEDFLNSEMVESNEVTDDSFVQVPFDHDMFIMFSSGTTGVPKCIVHSVGGTLIQIAKEHILHCDLRRDDVMMYYTTTGWMMWNWLVVGLYTGCSLLLYDGSPLLPTPYHLWDMVDEIGVSVLGTGAKWLSVLESRGVCPKKSHSLKSLRAILSTGSPLAPSSFDYVYRDIKEDLLLGSISGGTDIISCFMGGCPTLPVYRGEIQAKLLGMAIKTYDLEGRDVEDEPAELVCEKPFPSMPTKFWNDVDYTKYKKAYFSKFANVWTHGDFVHINSATGGMTMLGRSDGTLNPSGVRFGSAEIYNVVGQFPEISDSICVGQKSEDGDERVVLFVKLNSKILMEFDAALKKRLQTQIRIQLSARHVPSIIFPIDDIPYTVSGKKVEVAVKQVINGQAVCNKGSLINPDCLDLYSHLPELKVW